MDSHGETPCFLVVEEIVLRLCRGRAEHWMGTRGWVGSRHGDWLSDQLWGSPTLAMGFLTTLQVHLPQVV